MAATPLQADIEEREILFDRFADIREALYHPDLSRTFDPRTFEEGNPRAGILSVLHGDTHKARRRLENPLFRRPALVEYERELFPKIVQDVCARRAVGRADLFHLAGELAVVLAARRAGLDHDGSPEQLAELWGMAVTFSQAAAILDVLVDKEQIQAEARAVLREFDQRYVTPSRERRAELLAAAARGEDVEVPHDLISVVLARRGTDQHTIDDDQLVRECALYLHGGSQTSAQTTCNAYYYLLGLDGGRGPTWLERAGQDRLLAQRVVHETLRLRPATPRIKRKAFADVVIGGVPIPKGATAVLDIQTANQDPELFGPDAAEFNPERVPPAEVPLWGLSFGAGSHICIGRSVAGGFPLQGDTAQDGVGEEHLFGLVAQMVQAIAARGVRLDPDNPPVQDGRTSRGRWLHFPVVFPD